ncbi:MAG: Fe-S protein assembly co-chaperone HscB [Nitrospira sp.]|nr:Fe-S protein assembly co-chaperone HscB [Nitrospira sp.]
MDQAQKTSGKRTELQMARSMCWHCQSEVTGEYFCEQCIKVQPLSKELDYFTCLGLPRLLNIDINTLEAKFYALSRAFHPDFYQNKTESEQTISLENSALLNTAYRTLKDPIQRAEYLLKLEAGSAKDIRTSPPADLFEEILALQEDLEEYRSAQAGQNQVGLEQLRARLTVDRETLEQRQREMETRLFELFTTWDSLQSRQSQTEQAGRHLRQGKDAVLKEMRELLSNRTYLRNIVNDLIATTA